MIELLKYQKLSNEDNLEVFKSGIYNETDLVEVNIIGEDIAKFMYQAYYIINGKNKD